MLSYTGSTQGRYFRDFFIVFCLLTGAGFQTLSGTPIPKHGSSTPPGENHQDTSHFTYNIPTLQVSWVLPQGEVSQRKSPLPLPVCFSLFSPPRLHAPSAPSERKRLLRRLSRSRWLCLIFQTEPTGPGPPLNAFENAFSHMFAEQWLGRGRP